jgi:hypothetical protein
MSVEPNIPELDRTKRKLPISDRCCAPHPPCIGLIDPPGHPLSGRAHFCPPAANWHVIARLKLLVDQAGQKIVHGFPLILAIE